MGSRPRGQVPWPTRFYTLSCCLTQHFQQRNSSVYRTTCRKIYMFFRRPRITTDYKMDEAASGTGSLILSKTCRGHIVLRLVSFENRGNTMIRRVILMITRLFMALQPGFVSLASTPCFLAVSPRTICGLQDTTV